MLCCWEKTVEKKTITKPLLAESKSSASAGEPKIAERKLTGFEQPKPEPKPEPVVIKVEPKPEPVVIKVEPKPEPVTLPSKPTGPKPEPATFVEKNDFIPKEKKNRSKSNKR
jgi:hypothetical protein